jgi:mannose-6-phosphate isomerase-like protein (cupin superfamily)
LKRKKASLRAGFHMALSNRHAQVATMVLVPGGAEGGFANRHRGADQWLFVLEGRGTATVNGRRLTLSPGTLLLIERGDAHAVRNTGRRLLKTLNLYVPPAYTPGGEERRAAR